MQAHTTHLFCREGSSDKEYLAELRPEGEGWLVNVRYGRRGSSLTCLTKTPTPVPWAQAEKIYAKLVKEKRAKGYQEAPDADGAPAYQDAVRAGRDSGLRPMLLTPVDEVDVQVDLGDPAYVAQEKYDGERRMLRWDGTEVTGINRKGLVVPAALSLVQAMQSLCTGLTGQTVLDGEDLGERFAPFDLLFFNGRDLRHERYQARLHMLQALLGTTPPLQPALIAVRTAHGSTDKRAMLAELRAANAEGIVLKHADAPYEAGPSRHAHKFKFCASATVEVTQGREGKRSIGMVVRGEGDAPVFVGHCTVPANASIPPPGALVEVAYLYAMPTGSLIQPVFKGVRTDLDAADRHDSLKFKRADAA